MSNLSRPPIMQQQHQSIKTSYNDFVKDIYNGIKNINVILAQINSNITKLELRLDTLESNFSEHMEQLNANIINTQKQNKTQPNYDIMSRLDILNIPDSVSSAPASGQQFDNTIFAENSSPSSENFGIGEFANDMLILD
jgi:hypothetical protein